MLLESHTPDNGWLGDSHDNDIETNTKVYVVVTITSDDQTTHL